MYFTFIVISYYGKETLTVMSGLVHSSPTRINTLQNTSIFQTKKLHWWPMSKMLYKNVFKLKVQVKENPLKPFRKIYEAVEEKRQTPPSICLQFLNILESKCLNNSLICTGRHGNSYLRTKCGKTMFPHERIFFTARATKEPVALINAQMSGRFLHASGSYNIFVKSRRQ
jgi:hypothetical protein